MSREIYFNYLNQIYMHISSRMPKNSSDEEFLCKILLNKVKFSTETEKEQQNSIKPATCENDIWIFLHHRGKVSTARHISNVSEQKDNAAVVHQDFTKITKIEIKIMKSFCSSLNGNLIRTRTICFPEFDRPGKLVYPRFGKQFQKALPILISVLNVLFTGFFY